MPRPHSTLAAGIGSRQHPDLLHWMPGTVLAGVAAMVVKLFRGRADMGWRAVASPPPPPG